MKNVDSRTVDIGANITRTQLKMQSFIVCVCNSLQLVLNLK
ncbi:MAG: hypothetical protein JWO91_1889 [Acidobacteriaceae bacterium]|nr:hypothetical protein [Acidobacteriaceae bacterium]